MVDPKFPPLLWKRSTHVSFPHTYRHFETKSINGKSYRVRIQEITEDRFDEVLDFLNFVFLRDEVTSKVLNFVNDKLSVQDARKFHRRILDQKVSIMAVLDEDVPKPKLLGCNVTYVESRNDPPISNLLRGNSFKKQLTLFEVVRQTITPFNLFKSDIVLSEYGVCVDPDYRGYGIGYGLLSTWPAILKMYDIPGGMLLITNAKLQTIAEEIGFKTYAEYVYSEHRNKKGEMIFPIENPPTAKYMAIQYNNNIEGEFASQ